jgi:hypothetical protein
MTGKPNHCDTGSRRQTDLARNREARGWPHLGVHQAMDQSAVNDRTSSDAGTDCQINEILDVLRSRQRPFSKRCDVHVSIEGNRYVSDSRDGPRKIIVPPRELRR